MAQWIEGTVLENIHWTPALFSLKVDAEVDEFRAGQFTSLALDINGERVARPYSYLSAPGCKPVEFFFYTATGGKLSNALVKLAPGDRLWLKQQANGFFVLDEVPQAEDLWMLATGTGVAPFFSILETREAWQRFRHIVLVQAVRAGPDLLYQDLVQGFRARYGESFRFQAFVSREQVPATIHGRIPAAIENGALERGVGLQLERERSHVMACGNPDMVKDTIAVLGARGFARNRRRTPGQITIENFW